VIGGEKSRYFGNAVKIFIISIEFLNKVCYNDEKF